MTNVVLITGGSSGIGLGLVKKFIENSWQVIIFDLNSLPKEVSKERCSFFQTDLSKEEEIKKNVTLISEVYQKIDVIINCAGIIENAHSLESLEKEMFEKIIKVNLIAPFLLAKHGLPYLKQSPQANIINIGSISGLNKASSNLAYASSKAGLFGLTMSLAKQLASFGIRVNMISPGSVINTGLWKEQYQREMTIMDKAQLIKQSPLKRLNDPESIADVAYFLASNSARQITGVNIIVDGGVVL